MSLSASSSGSWSGCSTRSMPSRPTPSGRPASERRMAMTRDPKASARDATLRPIDPSPTTPTVMSRISVAESGCHVRSRWSSSSSGSRRMVARIIIITYSAMGSEKTPRALVMTSPRLAAAGTSSRSTPAVAEWTHVRRGARARMRSKVAAGSGPRSITSTSSSDPSARPSSEMVTSRAPGAAAEMRSRSVSR